MPDLTGNTTSLTHKAQMEENHGRDESTKREYKALFKALPFLHKLQFGTILIGPNT